MSLISDFISGLLSLSIADYLEPEEKLKNPKMIIFWDKEDNSVEVFLKEEDVEKFYKDHEQYVYFEKDIFYKNSAYEQANVMIFDSYESFMSQVIEEAPSGGWYSHLIITLSNFKDKIEELNIDLSSLD